MVRFACICALFALPLWSASGCDTESQGDPGGGGGIAGDVGSGGTAGDVGSGGVAGDDGSAGASGTGGQIDRCAEVNCADGDECTVDGTCNAQDGECVGGGFAAVDAPCGTEGLSFCDGAGECVECNASIQCIDDGNVCTTAVCEAHACTTRNVGGPCSFMGGGGICQNGVCIDANLCDPYPCEDLGECIVDQCLPGSGACSYENATNGTVCTANGYLGECVLGACELCAPVSCADGNQCTIDGVCNASTGNCDGAGNVPANTPCSQVGGTVCDGGGNCVQCNNAAQCNDNNDCTADSCIGHRCAHAALVTGTVCGGGAAYCEGGRCMSDPLPRQTFSGDRGDLYWAGSYAGIYDLWTGFYPYGLAGVYLNFTGAGVDHEVERIMPGFFFNTNTYLYARLEDQNADDGFTWTIDAQKLPFGTTRHSTSGCSDGFGFSQLLGEIPAGVEPVLLGFDLNRSTDHNLERIEARVFRSFGTYVYIELVFEDDGGADPFCYEVHYALVPSNRVRASGHLVETTSRTGSHTRAISATQPVLQGFELWFTNGDHHVDQLGLRLLPGELRVWLNDRNNDDPFRWEVWWLDLE